MKIYDRAKIMRRGSWFARRRQRGPEGAVLLEDTQPPDDFVKVFENTQCNCFFPLFPPLAKINAGVAGTISSVSRGNDYGTGTV